MLRKPPIHTSPFLNAGNSSMHVNSLSKQRTERYTGRTQGGVAACYQFPFALRDCPLEICNGSQTVWVNRREGESWAPDMEFERHVSAFDVSEAVCLYKLEHEVVSWSEKIWVFLPYIHGSKGCAKDERGHVALSSLLLSPFIYEVFSACWVAIASVG
jgi:hypothetical protein